jgi:biopolymer transport protein TolQ
MNAAATAALAPESFSALALFLRADWVVKGVMLGLLGASLWSWSVIIDKVLKFRALAHDADQIEDAIAAGRTLEDVAEAAGSEPRQALARLLQSALRTWYEARANDGISEAKASFILQRVDRGLDGIIARESERAEEGLGGLAIVATASPFIGLFGTVWGIMHAFQAIAVQKNTNLSVVAPSIAEALFATAIGLAAAIPAYMAYNKLSGDAGRFTSRLEAFADDLAGAIARRLGDRV